MLTQCQKAVEISHYNVIANIVQQCTYECVGRKAKGVETQVLLAPLPMSHIYALVVACHAAVWRGDSYVVLPKYDFRWFLEAIQKFKVEQILVVSNTRKQDYPYADQPQGSPDTSANSSPAR